MEKCLSTLISSDDSTKAYLLKGLDLPLVVEPADPLLCKDLHAARQWLDANEATLERWLVTYGAVLLRGFPVASTTDFSYFIKSYPEHRFRYLAGGAPRAKYLDKVYESTKLPPRFKLALHQEKAYMASYPRVLAFHCVVAPGSGGETILCDMRKVRGHLSSDLLSRFDGKGIKYVRNFRDANTESAVTRAFFSSYHRTWQEAFSVKDKTAVERACAEMQLDYSWMPDGSVTVTHCGVASLRHPKSEELIWFNHACAQHPNEISLGGAYRLVQRHYADKCAAPYEVRFGDDEVMQFEDLKPVYRALDIFECRFPWLPGDVMFVDNVRVAHGRNPYVGERRIEVSLLD